MTLSLLFFSEDSVWPVCSVVCRTLKGRYSKDLPALFEEPLVYGLLVDNEENEIPGESSPSLMTSKRVLEPSPFHKTWACEVRGQEARHSFHSPAWVCSTWGIQETQVTSAAAYLSLLALKITPKSNGLSQRPFSTFHTSRSAIKQAYTMRTLLCACSQASCLGLSSRSSDLCLVSSFWAGWVTLMLSVAFADLSSCELSQKVSLCLVLSSPWGVSSSVAPTGKISCQSIASISIKLESNRKGLSLMEHLKVSFSFKNFIHVYNEILSCLSIALSSSPYITQHFPCHLHVSLFVIVVVVWTYCVQLVLPYVPALLNSVFW